MLKEESVSDILYELAEVINDEARSIRDNPYPSEDLGEADAAEAYEDIAKVLRQCESKVEALERDIEELFLLNRD
jgi:hypothetical protein